MNTAPAVIARREQVPCGRVWREKHLQTQIESGEMTAQQARRVLAQAEAKTVWATRTEFIEALAAISSLYRSEVLRKSERKGKQVFEHLVVAASAERVEWLMNNMRWRSSQRKSTQILMPSGTTSNEALHAEMRGWFRQIQSLHQSTLHLKCKILLMRKLLEHNTALYSPTARQMPPAQILARSLYSLQFMDGVHVERVDAAV